MPEQENPAEMDIGQSSLFDLPVLLSNWLATVAKQWRFTTCSVITRAISLFILCFLPLCIAAANFPVVGAIARPAFATLSPSLGNWLFDPWIAFLMAWFAFFVAICANRAWSANELERTRIALGQVERATNSLPDLRGMAGFSALVLISITPLVLYNSNEFACSVNDLGCLFRGDTPDSLTWIRADADLLLRAVNFSIVQYVFSLSDISNLAPTTYFGRIIELVVLAALQLVAVATVIDLTRIQKAVRIAVQSLASTPEPAIVVGRRVLPQLIKALREKTHPNSSADSGGNDALFAKNAIDAIGEIGDPSALPQLTDIVAQEKINDWVRLRAVKAMAKLLEYLPLVCRTRVFGRWSDHWIKWRVHWWARNQIKRETEFRMRKQVDLKSGVVYRELSQLFEQTA